jgi:uncharacterized protein YeeX (DUF496 family)
MEVGRKLLTAESIVKKRQSQIRKASLSEANQRFIAKMREINFGRIENLEVKNGDLCFTRESIIRREFKLGSGMKIDLERSSDDFILKRAQANLILFLDKMKDGKISRIEIMHGLPFRIETMEFPEF